MWFYEGAEIWYIVYSKPFKCKFSIFTRKNIAWKQWFASSDTDKMNATKHKTS